MREVEDESVHLVVTSPPYNIGISYDKEWDDAMPPEEYARFTRDWIRECYRVLKPSGRIAINITVLGNSPTNKKKGGYIALQPIIIDALHQVAHKGAPRLAWRGETDLTKDEFIQFIQYSKNVWVIGTNGNNKHPAAFPTELPRRLIKFYCYVSDVVLDPFSGSGTTARAAKDLNRQFIAYDTSLLYVEMSRQRVAQENLFNEQLSARCGD